MKLTKIVVNFLFLCLSTAVMIFPAWAAEELPRPNTYVFKPSESKKYIRAMDDPTDKMAALNPKKLLPPEIWKYMVVVAEEAKQLTEEIVGFKSPDLVGKIAPEIKPGKYTYKDLEQFPGLKELFAPEMLIGIKPGGPPLICNIPEFEIIPTSQIYWFTRYSELTKKNLGKTNLDKDGYIIPDSWEGGCPFPRPSGEFMAQQLYYNCEKRFGWNDLCTANSAESFSFGKNLDLDKYNQFESSFIKLMGRSLLPPYGYLDERAKGNGEYTAFNTVVYEPRANRGTVVLQYKYNDPYKLDTSMIYVPSLRRIRKMSATDTQDPLGDLTYDDNDHISQKITPEKYPYKYDITAEREYLMPIGYNTATAWVDSTDGYGLKGVSFMRRPCYVLQMTQMDPNYIYTKRILYIDKETFICLLSANYDQKGRLYRTQFYTNVFMPDTAQFLPHGQATMQFDHLDLHSTFQTLIPFPVALTRQDFGLEDLIKRGK